MPTTNQPILSLAHVTLRYEHGITALDGTGGYSGTPTCLCVAIISSYQLHEATDVILAADPDAIINVMKSENYVGKFVQPKI